MIESGRGRLAACASFFLTYLLAYALVGSFDNAFDVVMYGETLAKHDAERMLSMVYDLCVVLGLSSLWVYDARGLIAGCAVGLLTALAAGGFHVAAYMGVWIPVAVAIGIAGGLVLLAAKRGKPASCVLLAAELALASLQVLFIAVAA